MSLLDRVLGTSRRIRAGIETHGWFGMTVPDDGAGHAFGYTIGLHESFAAPEIVLIGPPFQALGPMLHAVASAVKAGTRFGAAIGLYGSSAFPVLQCVLSDRDGRFPWDPECRPDFRPLQPILDR